MIDNESVGWLGFNQQSPIQNQQWLTGPSTNGRSSAFGALCLGSNPSGPARKQFSVLSSQFSLKNWSGALRIKRLRTSYGYFGDACRKSREGGEERSAYA